MTVTFRDGWLGPERAGAVDSAALVTLPRLPEALDGVVRNALFPDGGPRPLSVINTSLGRIGIIVLPVATRDVYAASATLCDLIPEATAMAHAMGAQFASLTGLIPSATNYAVGLATGPGRAAVTTGHATTVSAVVFALQKMVEVAGRCLEDESVAWVGVGSIGSSALRLQLEVMPHPARIILCDLFQARARLDKLAETIHEVHGFEGEIHVACSEVPDAAYDSRIIVGATNVAHVVDVGRLQPGTVLVDDSSPHCFDVSAAQARFAQSGDVLFTEGGLVGAPNPLAHEVFIPSGLHRLAEQVFAGDIGPLLFGERDIMGCILSGLLSAELGLPPTVGPVRPEDAVAHYWALQAEGFSSAELQCGTYRFDEADADRFRAGTRP